MSASSASSTDSPGLGSAASVHPALKTRVTEMLGIDYPVIQTGMGWVAGSRLTAATSEAGGLGILAAATMTFDEMVEHIHGVKERTDKPFGVNMRADQADVEDRIDVLIAEGVKLASFALAPKEPLIRKLKDAGVVVIPSVGAKRHAEKVASWGVDAVLVQGGEAGGHTGEVATTVLLPQVVDAVDIPVIAAGGFFDGRGLVAALAYGAEGVAMGTRFLVTSDSTVPETVKAIYQEKATTDTIRTTQVDGMPHRVLRTDLTEALEKTKTFTSLPRAVQNALVFKKESGTGWRDIVIEGLAMKKNRELSWSQVVMAANTPMLLKASMVDGRPDLGVMSGGQVVGHCDDLPSCDELVSRIVAQASDILSGFATADSPRGES